MAHLVASTKPQPKSFTNSRPNHCYARSCTDVSYIDFHTIKLRRPGHNSGLIRSGQLLDEETRQAGSTTVLPPLEKPTLYTRPENRFVTKKINNRVLSASEEQPSTRARCERPLQTTSTSLSRHFCELMGPNLCKDCSRRQMQITSLDEYQHQLLLSQVETVDPFKVLIVDSRSKKGFYGLEDDVYSDQEDEFSEGKPFTSPPPTPIDSGYSSRLSFIQSLARTSSPLTASSRLNSPLGSRERTPAKHQPSAQRSNEMNYSAEKLSTLQRPRTTGSVRAANNDYLAKLCSREGPLRKNIGTLYYPNKYNYAWRSLPVQPVVMDLNFINFTIYDTKLKQC